MPRLISGIFAPVKITCKKIIMPTNNIRFSPQTRADFSKELRQKVKEYFETNDISEYGNFSIIAKSILMISIYFAPYILMLTGVFESLLMVFISWAIMGVGMAGIGMVMMHDANHGTFSKNSKVNKWLGASLYLLGGYPPNWRHQHNTLHHRYTNIEGMDEDITTINMLRFSPHKPLKKIHRFQHLYAWFFYSLMTFSWATNKDFVQFFRYKKDNVKLDRKKNYNELLRDIIISKMVYYALFMALPLIFMSTAWYWIILGFLVMHFVSGFLLGIIFQTAHVMPDMEYPLPDEKGQIENNWLIHQLQTTSNYSPKSKWFSWLIGGLNYQVEHHLFPTISHVHYHKLAAVVQTTAQKYQIPYHVQPTFARAVKYHFLMLRSLGRK
jgi:linoleoyl-CoA desaturase